MVANRAGLPSRSIIREESHGIGVEKAAVRLTVRETGALRRLQDGCWGWCV
jgi:hypothetical protein